MLMYVCVNELFFFEDSINIFTMYKRFQKHFRNDELDFNLRIIKTNNYNLTIYLRLLKIVVKNETKLCNKILY